MSPEQLAPIETAREASPVELDPNVEVRTLQNGRSRIFEGYSKRKIAESLGSLAPGADVGIHLYRAIRGVGMGGEAMGAKERVMRSIIATTLSAGYTLRLSHMNSEGWAATAAAATLGTITFGPALLEEARKVPGLDQFLEASEEYLSDKWELAQEMAREMQNAVTANPDLILLNLNQ